jgi:hypothetical protein
MNRDDITRMAREAGFVGFDGDNGSLRRFAALVAAAEREACAQVCEQSTHSDIGDYWGQAKAVAIRARGQV